MSLSLKLETRLLPAQMKSAWNKPFVEWLLGPLTVTGPLPTLSKSLLTDFHHQYHYYYTHRWRKCHWGLKQLPQSHTEHMLKSSQFTVSSSLLLRVPWRLRAFIFVTPEMGSELGVGSHSRVLRGAAAGCGSASLPSSEASFGGHSHQHCFHWLQQLRKIMLENRDTFKRNDRKEVRMS